MIVIDRVLDFYKYSTKNIKFLLLVAILIFIIFYLRDYEHNFIISFIANILISGYGVEITRDTIRNGVRLPKMRPKKIITDGFKLYILTFVYFIPQGLILSIPLYLFDFDIGFEFGEIFFYLKDIFNLIVLNPTKFIPLILLFLVLSYISIFFYEIAIGVLADTESLKSTFNFISIKDKILNIGLKTYIIDYTELILTISILLFIITYINFIPFTSTLISIVIFIMQYRSIGLIYNDSF